MSDRFALHHGDCLEVLAEISDCSIDSVVCDPPYGLSFMGRKWDYDVPSEAIWRECLRVLKPGGHLLAFAGTRTQHRMAVRIEDAGFEIRDMIAWVYSTGFPKSLNVANAIHDAAIGQPQGGAKPDSPNHGKFKGGCSEDNETGRGFGAGPGQFMAQNGGKSERDLVEQSCQWQGWGTALKPAMEPITVARKPLIGTVAENVLKHGTGAINVDGCRVPLNGDYKCGANGRPSQTGLGDNYDAEKANQHSEVGRWPANFIHDGSDEVTALFPQTGKSAGGGGVKAPGKNGIYGNFKGHNYNCELGFGDSGSAARFFYCAKASKKDRGDQNNHPTVKPTDLMRYLCRLVTPPGGLILDPFMGSGSTGRAAIIEGFRFIGIEREAEYLEIAQARIAHAVGKTNDMLAFE